MLREFPVSASAVSGAARVLPAAEASSFICIFPGMPHYLEQVVDLTDPGANAFLGMGAEEARARVLDGNPEAVRAIEGSFALVARDGKTVRMARSLDRPMRYFLAKRKEGPALVVADRIDAILAYLKTQGFAGQFQPAYTRMVPAHHVVTLELIGCPDPSPSYLRFVHPLPAGTSDPAAIGKAYIGALAGETAKWLGHLPAGAPVGVCFSGGVDSGAVFLVVYKTMLELGLDPSRLKAFTLDAGNGPDADQARRFLKALGLGFFLETIDAAPGELEADDAVRVLEDYKALDVQCAAMGLALCRGIRRRYPDWRHLVDGDGGDENLKDYPIDENPELTVRSVVHNPMLYQEGWGVGTLKHSLTYSGGLSRSYARTYAPGRHCGFQGFSPFTRPSVVEVAAGIPFLDLAGYDEDRLYALKGAIVSAGVRAVTGFEMPVFPKRRFQHGALTLESMRERLPGSESDYRRRFLTLYA